MTSSDSFSTAIGDATLSIHLRDSKEAYKHLKEALATLKGIPTSPTESPNLVPVKSESTSKMNSTNSIEVTPISSLQAGADSEVLDSVDSNQRLSVDSTLPPAKSPHLESSFSPYPPPPPLTTYNGKIGRSAHNSPYNPSTPILPNSQVAYKPRTQPNADWILCRVLRVLSEVKFEIQDPEPDDLHPEGAIFKASAKEVILIPLQTSKAKPLRPYKSGTRVLAKYPETTVFYPAEVVECNSTICMLRFEGEEEEDKLTSVERPFVLPN